MIVVTFYTHLSASLTNKSLEKENIRCKMAPVPRELSSSCGSCVIVEGEEVDLKLIDEDYEAVYKQDGKNYIKISSNE